MQTANEKIQNLQMVTLGYLANLFSISQNELKEILQDISFPDLKYRYLFDEERDQVILSILKKTDDPLLRVVGENNNSVWERGWSEINELLARKDFSPDLLRPQYFEAHKILRFNQQFIMAETEDFVYQYDQLIRYIIFKKFLKDSNKIVELGSGTGTSQVLLSKINTHGKLIASDWSNAALHIIERISQYLKRSIKTVNFNMLTMEGWDDLTIDEESTVVTVHALEQLGMHNRQLLEKLLSAKPSLCVHLEPLSEFYNPMNLYDYLALKYHTRRNYLFGWLATLERYAEENKVEILQAKRLHFGDRYHEAYMLLVWRPK